MTLYLVRHGQTEENLQHILQGHMPGTLTAKGREQMRQAARQLAGSGVGYRCIVSSDLRRAMDSAEIIAEELGLPVVPMEILRERNWGCYTGMPVSEAADRFKVNGKWCFPDVRLDQQNPEVRLDQQVRLGQQVPETDEGIYERARKALALLAEQYADDNIIVVTHGQFARNLIAAHFDCSYHEVTPFVNAEVRQLTL